MRPLTKRSQLRVSASHAHYSLGDYQEAAASFQRGLDIEPGNASLTSALANAEARTKESEPQIDTPSTRAPNPGAGPGGMDFAGMADMLRGMGGGGPEGEGGAAGGGLGGLLNNPMMMQMAQQMMANGGLERMMQNPTVANMVGHSPSNNPFPDATSPLRTTSEPTSSDESHAIWRWYAFND